MEQDQERCCVGRDLGPNYMQRLSADNNFKGKVTAIGTVHEKLKGVTVHVYMSIPKGHNGSVARKEFISGFFSNFGLTSAFIDGLLSVSQYPYL